MIYFVFLPQSSSLGQELLDRVFRHLNLLETAYFGLRYLDHENQTVRDFNILIIKIDR